MKNYCKHAICVLLVLFLVNIAFARQALRELKVGDLIPDLKFTNLLNHPSGSVSLSDFKGKLLILDFWATWCGPCVGAFPKQDSLQHEFQDKLQILPVTAENKETVSSFFEKMQKLNKKTPLTVVGDNVLNRIFTHSTVPHYVWIDGNGKVLAITEGKDVTRENIKSAIEGREFAYMLKKDEVENVVFAEGNVPIAAGLNVRNNGKIEFTQVPDSVLYVQSALTGYVNGIGEVPNTGNMVGVFNSPIVGLYKAAFWKFGQDMMSEAKTVTEIDDPHLYELITALRKDGKSATGSGMEFISWLKENGYSYQLKVPKNMNNQKFDIMVQDLNRYFGAKYGIEGRIEKRKSTCLALVRTSKNEKYAAKANTMPVYQSTKLSLQVKGLPMSLFMMMLGQPLQEQPPLVNETGYAGNIDMEVNCNLYDVAELNKELAKYELKLVKKDILQEIAVIRKKTNTAGAKR